MRTGWRGRTMNGPSSSCGRPRRRLATASATRVRKTAPLLARNAVQVSERAAVAPCFALAVEQKDAAARSAREDAEKKGGGRGRSGGGGREAAARWRRPRRPRWRNQAARADLVARLNRVPPTRETSRGIVAEIAGVQFAIGAATLNADANVALARFAGIVGIYPSMQFRVEGHTDMTGSVETNRTLSLARANAVRDYLAGRRASRPGASPSSASAQTSRLRTTRHRRAVRATGAWRSS